MYGVKVSTRRRPAGSVGEFSQPLVTKTERSGVLAAIQSAASTSLQPSTTSRLLAVQAETRSGEGMLISRTAVTAQAGQRRISQAASSATAIHIAWKYLFMSKPMVLT